MNVLGIVDLPAWAIGLVTFFVALYLYLTKNKNYWTKKGVKQVDPTFIIGSWGDIYFKPFHEVEQNYYKKLGPPIYGSYNGSDPMVHILDPGLIKDVLIKDFQYFYNRRYFPINKDISMNLFNAQDENWKRLRTILTPAFASGKIKRMSDLFTTCSKMLVDNLKDAAQKGSTFDAKRYFGAFTMDVICSAAFGIKIDSQKNPQNPFVQYARKLFNFDATIGLVLLLLLPNVAGKLGIEGFDVESIRFFKKVTLEIIKKRKAQTEKANDFLQLLIDGYDGDENDEKDNDHFSVTADEKHVTKVKGKVEKLNEIELISNSILFFLVGYDTTASMLSFLSYCLSLNPESQTKLQNEVDAAFRSGPIDYDKLKTMPYLEACISETLRMYPAVSRTERQATSDYALGDTGVVIPKGMHVAVPIYAIHRDPQYFPEPDKYKPERFLPENRHEIVPFTYIPFGGGPKQCVGMRFALTEGKFALAHVIRNIEFFRVPQTKVPLEFYKGQQLMQPRDITIGLRLRKHEE